MDSKIDQNICIRNKLFQSLNRWSNLLCNLYKETSKKRFLDAIHSTSYTLKIFERLVKEGEKDAIEETND